MDNGTERRPIAARGTWWSRAMADALRNAGITPNQVSLFSLVFASFGGLLLIQAAHSSAMVSLVDFVAAAGCVQMRLLCNLLDGMIAIEGGQRSRLGPLFNELPDRPSDIVLLVCAGYAASSAAGVELGWAAAVLAVLTAYIRAFGSSLGIKQDFCGPMAKQHRMFVLTIACLFAGLECVFKLTPVVMTLSLAVIAAGALITCVRRTFRLAKALEAGS